MDYRNCLRRWDWAWSFRGNLEARDRPVYFWTGTGFHYALEDFHSPSPHRLFPTAADAFKGYFAATKATGELPDGAEADRDLAVSMLEYYEEWMANGRPALQTYIRDGHPQTEVRFEITIADLSIPQRERHWSLAGLYEMMEAAAIDRVVYRGTFDRVIEDEWKRLWICEYKTAKNFETGHFDTDPQISAYSWAARICYPDKIIAGTVYQQHKKQAPKAPPFLSSTKMFSCASTLKTTYALYRGALIRMYGEEQAIWPAPNRQYLERLLTEESDRADDLIRRDYIDRNEHQCWSEQAKIIKEATLMINPAQYIYPNPTRDCSWRCGFLQACINYDDGSDWQLELENGSVPRMESEETWRTQLPRLVQGQQRLLLPDSMESQLQDSQVLPLQPPLPKRIRKVLPDPPEQLSHLFVSAQ